MRSLPSAGRAVPALLLLVVLAFVTPDSFGMGSSFYSEEVFTSTSLSGGFAVDDSIYFLARYTLYQAPRGIARFPDGGRVRRLFENVCLYEYDTRTDRLDRLDVILEDPQRGLNVATSYFELGEYSVRVVFASSHGTREDPDAWHAVAWNIGTRSVEYVGDDAKIGLLDRFTYEHPNRLTIDEVKRAVSEVPADAWSRPSPLDYVIKTDGAYTDDLVALRGDQAYRDAIIVAIARGDIDADPLEIISRIDQRISSREGLDRDTYEFFVRDTRERLDAIAE